MEEEDPMAGHSKWANIRHRKAASDAKRSKLWSKLIRAVTVAAKLGEPDPQFNPRLRTAIDEAKAANCPNDTIDRAIKKGSGAGASGEDWQNLSYEGYAPGGVALLVECLTDNRNRTASDVRSTFTKRGGTLGTDGCVSYLFTRTGLFTFPAGTSEDKLYEVGLENGAEEVEANDDGFEVSCGATDFHKLKDAFEAAELMPESAELAMIPSTTVELDEDNARKVLRLIDALEDLDDVQKVHGNYEVSDELLAKIEGE